METVVFDGEDGSELEFGILEQTRVGGVDYLLVIDPDEAENENGSAAYILKDISEDGDKDGCYPERGGLRVSLVCSGRRRRAEESAEADKRVWTGRCISAPRSRR